MARRRYQRGSIKFIRGKFIGRWREDVVLAGGKVNRVNRKKILGTKSDFATKREAQRALDVLLAPINSLTYRPVHRVSFLEFAERWIANVLPTYKVGGSQCTTRKQVRNRLVPALGNFTLQEITAEVLQGYVAGLQKQDYSPKYIRNLVSTLGRCGKPQLHGAMSPTNLCKASFFPSVLSRRRSSTQWKRP